MQTGNEEGKKETPVGDWNWSYWNHDFGNGVCMCTYIHVCLHIRGCMS